MEVHVYTWLLVCFSQVVRNSYLSGGLNSHKIHVDLLRTGGQFIGLDSFIFFARYPEFYIFLAELGS